MPLTKSFAAGVTDPAGYDLGELAAAERLWVRRHRLESTRERVRDGQGGRAPSHEEAAERIGVSRGAYARLESGASTLADAEMIVNIANEFAPLDPPATTAELCLLARRRSAMNLAEIETEFDLSRVKFLPRERAGDPTVVRFWEEKGFRFPTEAAR